MKLEEFRKIIKNELHHGDKRIVYMCSENDDVKGGICETKEDAIINIKEELKGKDFKNPNMDINIVLYGEDNIKVIEKAEVLYNLGRISKETYLNEKNKM